MGSKGAERAKALGRQLRERRERRALRAPSPPRVPAPPAPVVLDPPGVASDEAPAPPQEVHARPRAGGKGEWRVIDVPNGWLTWSIPEGRVDSHCKGHAGCSSKCSMNRQLKAGAVGLALLWLERGAGRDVFRYDHEILKESLSSSDAVAPRSACRAAFEARALAGDAEVAALLEAESVARDGSRDEPQSLACPSLHRTLVRLMEDPTNLGGV